jgi:pyrroline-5-carboxylate reductase
MAKAVSVAPHGAVPFEMAGPLVILGAGKMGGAILTGLIGRGFPTAQIRIQDPSVSAEVAALLAGYGLKAEARIASLPSPPSMILAAVKPQVMDQVFSEFAGLAGPETVTVSIAAGKSIASFEKHLAKGAAVVRAMPNTPAAIGRGMTVCVANAATSENQRAQTDSVLRATGDVAWIDNESQMDAVTAVSGSGPAYVFLLAECLAEAGRAAGLDAKLAAELARGTIAGSGELMRQSPLAAAELRQNVTSPGGTTAAALAVLMAEPGLQDLMTRAISANAARSRELAKG